MNQTARDSKMARAERAARAGFAVAAALLGLKLIVFGLASEHAWNVSFLLGAFAGFFGDAVFASVLAYLPGLAAGTDESRHRLVAGAIAFAYAVPRAVAAHYHAALLRLPTRASLSDFFALVRGTAESRGLRGTMDAHAPLWLLSLECTLVAAAAGVIFWVLQSKNERRVFERSWPAVLTLGVLLWVGVLARSVGQMWYGAAPPVLSLLVGRHEYLDDFSSKPPDPNPPTGATVDAGVNQDVFGLRLVALRLEKALRTTDADSPRLARYPTCAETIADVQADISRSVVLVVLEGVGARELNYVRDGKPLMPALSRIAADGVSFPRFFAAGDRSSQGLVSIVSGISSTSHQRILSSAIRSHLRGFPADLKEHGVISTYHHGSDLSFEGQRGYLRETGFTEIHEPDPHRDVYEGWGIPDGELFSRTKARLDAARRKNEPVFSLVFTLTTHDPYALPRGETPAYRGTDELTNFHNTVAYTDRVLGEFYDWFKANEAPRGTVLMVTGDHIPRVRYPEDPRTTTTGELEYGFHVPFVIANLRPDETVRARANLTMPSGHLDISRTVLDLYGLDQKRCYQGRSLIDSAHPADPSRPVVSHAGERLEFFYVHQGSIRWMLNRQDQSVRAFDLDADPRQQRDISESMLRERESFVDLARLHHSLGSMLLGNGFAPPERELAPVHFVRRPLVVASHRGNIAGPSIAALAGPRVAERAFENTIEGALAAESAGFSVVELDVQITADDVAVVFHDPDLPRSGRPTKDGGASGDPIRRMTLGELRSSAGGRNIPTLAEYLAALRPTTGVLIELKPQVVYTDGIALMNSTLRVLDGDRPSGRRVIIDSFSRTMLASAREWAGFETGYDFPQSEPKVQWLDFAREERFEWVYIEERFVTAELVAAAHQRGVRVMAYTVDDESRAIVLRTFGTDGILTNQRTVADALRRSSPAAQTP